MRCTAGGDGGHGGDGGCGGNAGGAAGGPSLPILRIAVPVGGIGASRALFVTAPGSNQQVPNFEETRARFLVIGAGGEGGVGGDGCDEPAQPGLRGVERAEGCCRIGASCTPGGGLPLVCAD